MNPVMKRINTLKKKKEQRDWLIVTNPRLKSHCHKNWIWRHFKNHIFFTEIEK